MNTDTIHTIIWVTGILMGYGFARVVDDIRRHRELDRAEKRTRQNLRMRQWDAQ